MLSDKRVIVLLISVHLSTIYKIKLRHFEINPFLWWLAYVNFNFFEAIDYPLHTQNDPIEES